LFKCLKTHYEQHCEPFYYFLAKLHYNSDICIQSQKEFFSGGNIPQYSHGSAPSAWLDPDTNFRLAPIVSVSGMGMEEKQGSE